MFKILFLSAFLSFFASFPKNVDTPYLDVDFALAKTQVHYSEQVKKHFRHAKDAVIVAAVSAAVKYEHLDFPRTHDIMAIIGIESSWNPTVSSGLKSDKAYGLTQIRPEVWSKMIKGANMNLVENQVKFASEILHHYYVKLGSKEKAILAYNLGIGTVRRGGDVDKTYWHKYKKEHSRMEQV